jgi:cytokinin dehydrogenase
MGERSALAFDRTSQSWVTSPTGGSVAQAPELDGNLLVDESSLEEGGEDFGHLRRRRPIAVLEPGSAEDIVRMVGFAREQSLKIGIRGRSSSVFGQSLVEGGILVKMEAFDPAPIFGDGWVWVSAGRSWTEILSMTLPRGLRPPVLTHNTELSVGGTLSVGGMDGGSYRHGGQVDNVLEIEVVTGEGRLETCSAEQLPELFNAVLGGVGQCAVIVRAKLRLIPAGSQVRIYELLYPDLETMLNDERLMVADGRIDRISGYIFPSAGGKWRYYIQADHNFAPPHEPGLDLLPVDGHHLRGFERVYSMPYFDFVTHNPRQAELKQTGRIKKQHPWMDVFIPDSEANKYLAETMGTLTPADISVDFPISFFFINSAACTRPLLRLPNEASVCLWNLMTTAPDLEAAEKNVQMNRRFFEQARAVGGKYLPVSALPLTSQDWEEHFDPYWDQLVSAKHRFDPDNVLSPGPGIF